MSIPAIRPFRALAVLSLVAFSMFGSPTQLVRAQDQAGGPPSLYQQIKAFSMSGASMDVANLVLKRDRIEMTFTGVFYFMTPIDGHVTGAVFTGQGTVRADVPPSEFEKDSVRRLLGSDTVESDFKTAVLRMSDDTYDAIQRVKPATSDTAAPVRTLGMSAPPAAVQRLAADFEPRLTKETGINLSARLTTSIMNAEAPGVFFAEFDGGKRGRFDAVLDYQNRIPAGNFDIDGGEKGLFFNTFSYQATAVGKDVWMAFYALEDYARNTVPYSDANNLVDVSHYDMDVDARDPSSKLGLATRIDMVARVPNVRAIPFRIGEELGTYGDARLKNQMRMKSAHVAGQTIPFVQEDWESGFTVQLPKPLQAGEKLSLDVELEGNFFRTFPLLPECFYLQSNDTWYPRHGFLNRATFDITYRHAQRHVIASGGLRVSEGPDPNQKNSMVTKYTMDQPVALLDFAVGHFERAKQMVKWENGDPSIPLEFNGLSHNIVRSVDDFVLAELDNALRYFANYFGKYPYPAFSATLHPYGFGQGFPTMLFLAVGADAADANTFRFISHETAHQWWGGIVAWRSYRDQWLSEGFAEYSGILYASARVPEKDRAKTLSDLIHQKRESLRGSPRTPTGVLNGRLADIGPIILGQRLNTSKSLGAYTALIYDKGSMVLRMLHFLLSNPSNGDDKAFREMMSSFVAKYRGGSASTEEFAAVAGEAFARTPIAQKYGLRDLNWFFREWVWQTGLPSYSADYELKDQADGSCLVTGTIHQENAMESWSMPLPIVFTLANNQQARTTILASGPSNAFQLKLPSKPIKVDLDPASWVLSEKTTIRPK